MKIDEKAVDDIQRLINAGQIERLRKISISGITPGAMLELACRSIQWSDNPDLTDIFKNWRNENRYLNIIWEEIFERRLSDNVNLDPTPFDYLHISYPLDSGGRWTAFQQRFKRTLEDNRFSGKLANALTRAMREMVDNILNHSGDTEIDPAPGIVAYYITEGAMTYAVADLGRGVLKSFQCDDNYYEVETSHEALKRAVKEQRSRRPEHPNGVGFRTVFRSLVDLNGVLRFRTGDAVLTVTGQLTEEDDSRCFEFGQSPDMPGFQLSVHCNPSGSPSQKFLP